MAVSVREFIDSARQLSNGKDEIDYRNATSRAYYAAFHEAQKVSVHSNGSPGNRKGIHEKLCEVLRSHRGTKPPDQDIRTIGIILSMCKKERVNADYQIALNYSKADTLKTISQAENIISLSTHIP